MSTRYPHMRCILGLLSALLTLLAAGCASERQVLQMTARYEQYEKLVEADAGKSKYIKTSQLFPLCEAYGKLKRYHKLFACLDRLDDNLSKGDKSTNDWSTNTYLRDDVTPFVSMMRAEAYIELADYAKAIEETKRGYEKTLKGSFPVWDETLLKIKTYAQLSMAYAFSGNRREAEKYRDLLVDLDIPFGGGALNNQEKQIAMAKVHAALGEYGKALKYLEQSPGIMASMGSALVGSMIGAKITYFELPHQFMIDKCLFETGRLQEAKEGYDRLLQRQQTCENGEIYWMTLFDRGRIEEKDGRLKEAIGFYTKAVGVIEQQRASIHTEANKIGFVGDKQAVYHHLVRSLYRDGQYEKAFECVERAKARALVDILASKKDFALKGGNEQEIRTVLAMNDSLDQEAIVQDAAIDKNKTRSIQVKVREDLKAKSAELASLVTVTSPPIAELQSVIPGDEALIEYYYRDKDMYAFILSDGKLRAVKLDGKGLTEDVQAFRKLIGTPASTRSMDMSRKLYERLFHPLEGALNKRNLIIVSHGALHYLPMNALHDGTGYLIDRYSIRMMPSASAMKYLRQRKTAGRGGVLIFGNPDLGDPGHDLEYAQREALEIARIRPKSKVLVRKKATEEALRRYCHNYRYLHFATHGQFSPEDPLKSALLLAPDAASNGMLTVDKLYSLDLDVDLVTLSACETGLSKIASGDDLVGLTRGFLYAGSGSIVASLWKVDDLATSQLMTRFYKELEKTGKREALRTAQLENKKKYPHPYYWAAFQLTGNAN